VRLHLNQIDALEAAVATIDAQVEARPSALLPGHSKREKVTSHEKWHMNSSNKVEESRAPRS